MEDEKRRLWNELSGKDAQMIHADLLNLTSELKKCNRYLDIFFTANGVYEDAAEVILMRRLAEAGEKTEVQFRGVII